MPYTTPPNFTSGQLVDDTDLDTLSDDITFLANPPKVRAYNSINISHTTSGTLQAVTFNSERFDTDTLHSTSVNTSRITITTSGTYLIGGNLEFAAHATGNRTLSLRLDGTTYIAHNQQPSCGGAVTTPLSVATLYAFVAGQYIELMANQDSGAALNIVANGNFSPEFWAVWQSI